MLRWSRFLQRRRLIDGRVMSPVFVYSLGYLFRKRSLHLKQSFNYVRGFYQTNNVYFGNLYNTLYIIIVNIGLRVYNVKFLQIITEKIVQIKEKKVLRKKYS